MSWKGSGMTPPYWLSSTPFAPPPPLPKLAFDWLGKGIYTFYGNIGPGVHEASLCCHCDGLELKILVRSETFDWLFCSMRRALSRCFCKTESFFLFFFIWISSSVWRWVKSHVFSCTWRWQTVLERTCVSAWAGLTFVASARASAFTCSPSLCLFFLSLSRWALFSTLFR